MGVRLLSELGLLAGRRAGAMHFNNALMVCDVRSSVNTKREGYPAKEWVIRPFYLVEEFYSLHHNNNNSHHILNNSHRILIMRKASPRTKRGLRLSEFLPISKRQSNLGKQNLLPYLFFPLLPFRKSNLRLPRVARCANAHKVGRCQVTDRASPALQ